ncbi:AMP-binding protein, partial [Ruminococcus champanellensis]|uniref:AMP-binding protein n=1 Tax=Ruminococcus champanellensis TaxID=1161942 RepID=UPI0039F5FB36
MTRHLEYPDCSLYGQIAKTAKAYPDGCALSYYGRRITYRKLMEMIDRCGEALSSLHIQKGDSVAVILPNMPQTVIVFYALNKLGAVANMIHPLSARGEIEYYLQLSGSKVILALDGIAEKLEGLSADTIIIVFPDSFMPLPLRIAYRIR